MRRPNGRELKALLILSVVVPISILAALKLIGILQEPITITETTTLEPVEWKCERPDTLMPFSNERNQMSYHGDGLSFYCDLRLSSYDPQWFGYGPGVFVGINNLTVSAQNGFIYGIQINFSEEYQYSLIIIPTPPYGSYSNLTLEKVIDYSDPQLGNNTKASISWISIGKPARVCVEHESVLWLLKSPYNYTHKIEIVSEFVYFNGTAYRKLVQPLHLMIEPDNNNSFENAEEISFGVHDGFIGGGVDTVDFYKISMLYGDEICISMIPQKGQNFDLYLYSPSLELKENSTNPGDYEEFISCIIDSPGYWFIKVRQNGGQGPYTISVTQGG